MRNRNNMFASALLSSILIGLCITTLPIAFPKGINQKVTSRTGKLEIVPGEGMPVIEQDTASTRAAPTSEVFLSGDYTLKAVQIDGYNAHLKLFSNLSHPTLTFTTASIYGLQLSHPVTSTCALTITADGIATANKVAIKTSLFDDLNTALGSFTNKGDILKLITGGTVKHLVMKNVRLKIDRSIQADAMLLPGLQLSVVKS